MSLTERRLPVKAVVCRKCVHLVNEWCQKVNDSPDPDAERDCQYFREKTNADRIRSMSDDNLAEFLCQVNGCYQMSCPGAEMCVFQGDRANGLKKWLKQPAEDTK